MGRWESCRTWKVFCGNRPAQEPDQSASERAGSLSQFLAADIDSSRTGRRLRIAVATDGV